MPGLLKPKEMDVKLIRSIRLPLAGLAAIAVLSGCGNGANPVAVTPLPDTTPPPAPTNLVLSADNVGHPVLVWSDSAAPDVAGYQVYVLYPTQPGAGNEYVPADDAFCVDPVFQLPVLTESVQVSYRVRAVDNAGNWSAFSTALSVLIPSAAGAGSDGKDIFEIE